MRPEAACRNDSWINKQYMTERDFEIEHAIDESYHEIKPHFHEFYELFFFVSGHVDYIIGDEMFALQKGGTLHKQLLAPTQDECDSGSIRAR